jgi:hypothetical protein
MTTLRPVQQMLWASRMARMPCTVVLLCSDTNCRLYSWSTSIVALPASGWLAGNTTTTSSVWYGVTCGGQAAQRAWQHPKQWSVLLTSVAGLYAGVDCHCSSEWVMLAMSNSRLHLQQVFQVRWDLAADNRHVNLPA